jgi:hypothetical protein
MSGYNNKKAISAKLFRIIEDYTNLQTPDGEPDSIEEDCIAVLKAVWDIGTKNMAKVERKIAEKRLAEIAKEEKTQKEEKKKLKAQLGLMASQEEE